MVILLGVEVGDDEAGAGSSGSGYRLLFRDGCRSAASDLYLRTRGGREAANKASEGFPPNH
jgi:hypothetical protein